LIKSIISYFKGILGYSILILNTIIGFILLLPIAYLKKLTSNNNIKKYCLMYLHKVGKTWIQINYLTIRISNKLNWRITGLEQLLNLPKDKWYLLIANHQSWADVFILQFIFRNHLPFQKYFIKEQLRQFPLMGFIWEAIDCPFLKRLDNKNLSANPVLQGADLLEIKEKSKKFKLLPSTIVSFLEGTRFTTQKHQQQQSEYKFLLKPKAGGIACVLQELHKEIKGIVDVSLFYPNKNVTLWDLYTGRMNNIAIKINFITIPKWLSEKHLDNLEYELYKDEFQIWLKKIWLEKDQFMQDQNILS